MIAALLGRNGRVILLILVAVVVQGPVLDRIQVARAHPDLLLLLPVIAGLVAGPGAVSYTHLTLPTKRIV